MIDCFGPGVGHLDYLAVPGVGIFEFLFVPVVGQYLTRIPLRETETECSSRVAHALYNWQSWRSSKMRRCVNFRFFFPFVLCISLFFLYFNVSVFHVVQMKTNKKKCCRFDARNLIRIDYMCFVVFAEKNGQSLEWTKNNKKFIGGVSSYEDLSNKRKMSSFYQ